MYAKTKVVLISVVLGLRIGPLAAHAAARFAPSNCEACT
jgi:hypothetical protein